MENNGCAAREEKGPGTARARAPPETPKMSNAGSAECWAASLLVCGSVRSHRSSAPSPVLSTVAPFRRALPVEPARARIGGRHHRCPAPPRCGRGSCRWGTTERAGKAGTTSTSSAGPALAGFIGMAVALRRAAPAGHSGRQALVRGGGARGRALPRAAREPASAGQTTEPVEPGNQCRTNHRTGNQEPCRTNHRGNQEPEEPVPDKPPNGFGWFREWFRMVSSTSPVKWANLGTSAGQTTEWFRMVSSTSPVKWANP